MKRALMSQGVLEVLHLKDERSSGFGKVRAAEA